MDTTEHVEEEIATCALEQRHLQEITELAAELKRILVRHYTVLKEEDAIRKEMVKLEEWLEVERTGHAPAGIISEGGFSWLCALRDRLKLSADELLRMEGEGGNPTSREQAEKTESLLNLIRRIDRIIDESLIAKPH